MEQPAAKCYSCSKVIQGRVLSALGKSYHPQHFTCAKCQLPITADKFREHNGQPYCERDFSDLFAKRCRACKKPIIDKVINACGFDWHAEHFNCDECKKPLAGETFFERNGLPFCKEDYQSKFADKCMQCHEPIVDKAVVALNGKWHPDCFKCIKCNKPIVEDAFQVEEGKPVCSKCAS